jgi:hypothetical protein
VPQALRGGDVWIYVVDAALGMAGCASVKATIKYLVTGQKPGDQKGKKK